MNYKDCLILATILFWPNNKFDCEALAKLLFVYRLYRISTNRIYQTLQEMTKRTSGDLDRLYKMGFLLRKPVKRIVITLSGKIHRGFKYEYSLSTQGWQYFLYLIKQIRAEQGISENQNSKLVLTGDPLLEPLYRKIIASHAKISPRALDLAYEYVELAGRRGGRYNRFRSNMDKKLLVTLFYCAEELQDRFEIALAKTDKFMAVYGMKHSKEVDIHRSRVIEACQSSNESAKATTKVILALADKARRYMQSGQYNQELPVSPKHPYVILEVDEMLQRMAKV